MIGKPLQVSPGKPRGGRTEVSFSPDRSESPERSELCGEGAPKPPGCRELVEAVR
jgi:hypothetical protein